MSRKRDGEKRDGGTVDITQEIIRRMAEGSRRVDDEVEDEENDVREQHEFSPRTNALGDQVFDLLISGGKKDLEREPSPPADSARNQTTENLAEDVWALMGGGVSTSAGDRRDVRKNRKAEEFNTHIRKAEKFTEEGKIVLAKIEYKKAFRIVRENPRETFSLSKKQLEKRISDLTNPAPQPPADLPVAESVAAGFDTSVEAQTAQKTSDLADEVWRQMSGGVSTATEEPVLPAVGQAIESAPVVSTEEIKSRKLESKKEEKMEKLSFYAATGSVDQFVEDLINDRIPKDGSSLAREYAQFQNNNSAEIENKLQQIRAAQEMGEKEEDAKDPVVSPAEESSAQTREEAIISAHAEEQPSVAVAADAGAAPEAAVLARIKEIHAELAQFSGRLKAADKERVARLKKEFFQLLGVEWSDRVDLQNEQKKVREKRKVVEEVKKENIDAVAVKAYVERTVDEIVAADGTLRTGGKSLPELLRKARAYKGEQNIEGHATLLLALSGSVGIAELPKKIREYWMGLALSMNVLPEETTARSLFLHEVYTAISQIERLVRMGEHAEAVAAARRRVEDAQKEFQEAEAANAKFAHGLFAGVRRWMNKNDAATGAERVKQAKEELEKARTALLLLGTHHSLDVMDMALDARLKEYTEQLSADVPWYKKALQKAGSWVSAPLRAAHAAYTAMGNVNAEQLYKKADGSLREDYANLSGFRRGVHKAVNARAGFGVGVAALGGAAGVVAWRTALGAGAGMAVYEGMKAKEIVDIEKQTYALLNAYRQNKNSVALENFMKVLGLLEARARMDGVDLSKQSRSYPLSTLYEQVRVALAEKMRNMEGALHDKKEDVQKDRELAQKVNRSLTAELDRLDAAFREAKKDIWKARGKRVAAGAAVGGLIASGVVGKALHAAGEHIGPAVSGAFHRVMGFFGFHQPEDVLTRADSVAGVVKDGAVHGAHAADVVAPKGNSLSSWLIENGTATVERGWGIERTVHSWFDHLSSGEQAQFAGALRAAHPGWSGMDGHRLLDAWWKEQVGPRGLGIYNAATHEYFYTLQPGDYFEVHVGAHGGPELSLYHGDDNTLVSERLSHGYRLGHHSVSAGVVPGAHTTVSLPVVHAPSTPLYGHEDSFEMPRGATVYMPGDDVAPPGFRFSDFHSSSASHDIPAEHHEVETPHKADSHDLGAGDAAENAETVIADALEPMPSEEVTAWVVDAVDYTNPLHLTDYAYAQIRSAWHDYISSSNDLAAAGDNSALRSAALTRVQSAVDSMTRLHKRFGPAGE